MKGPVFAAIVASAAALHSSSSSSHHPSASSSHHSSSVGAPQPSGSTTALKPFELKVVANKQEADLKDTFAGEDNVVSPAQHEIKPQPEKQVALIKPSKRHNDTKGKPEPQTSKVLKFELVNGELQIVTSEKKEHGAEPAKTYISLGKEDKDGMVAVNIGGTPAKGFHLKEVAKEHHSSTSHKAHPTTTMAKVPKGTGKAKKHHVKCHNETTGNEGKFYACPAASAHPLPTGAEPKHTKRDDDLEISAPTNVPVPVKGHDLFVHFGDKQARKECMEIELEVFRHEHKHHKTSTSSHHQTSTSTYPHHPESTHSSHSSHSSHSTHSSHSSHSTSQSVGYQTHPSAAPSHTGY